MPWFFIPFKVFFALLRPKLKPILAETQQYFPETNILLKIQDFFKALTTKKFKIFPKLKKHENQIMKQIWQKNTDLKTFELEYFQILFLVKKFGFHAINIWKIVEFYEKIEL